MSPAAFHFGAQRAQNLRGPHHALGVWGGTLPLDKWQEETGIILDVEPPPAYAIYARLLEVLQPLRDKPLSPLSPQGPTPRPSAEQPITWLFEPDSFAPLARLQGERRESIVCDHLGRPLAMFNSAIYESGIEKRLDFLGIQEILNLQDANLHALQHKYEGK